MEFNEKLQELRKQNKLTQEALAQSIFVSRAAISKWESGRGYPNIESLKSLSRTFNVSIDDLLSGEELIFIAEKNQKENTLNLGMTLFALLDIMNLIFLFIPLFGQKSDDMIISVSLFNLKLSESYMVTIYLGVIISHILWGVIEIALQNFHNHNFKKYAPVVSLMISIFATIIFIISQQPYMAFFMLWVLISKAFIYIKQQGYGK